MEEVLALRELISQWGQEINNMVVIHLRKKDKASNHRVCVCCFRRVVRKNVGMWAFSYSINQGVSLSYLEEKHAIQREEQVQRP